MRAIKFRAWKKADSRFIHSDWKHGRTSFFDTVDQDFAHEYGPLEQFTGLLDKNGEEIYEGDFVRYQDYNTRDKDWKVANVYWMDWADWAKVPFLHPFGSPTSGKDMEDGRSSGTHFITPPNASEVIGNIHENPELLES